jgi:hypothetical protein
MTQSSLDHIASTIEILRNREKALEAIKKWLKESGMKVNQAKTEVCLF